MFNFLTDVVSLSLIFKHGSIFGCWESGELLLLLLFSTKLFVVFWIDLSLMFTTIGVNDLVDDDDVEFVEEDAGDVKCTVLSLFVVDFTPLSLFIVDLSL